MRIITDETLLEKYSEQTGFKSFFSCWDDISKKLVSYQKGEYIALHGSAADRLFYLVEGSIRFTSIAENYTEYYLYDLQGKGMFGAGEYALEIPTTTQSLAVEDCLVIQIPIKENRKVLDEDIKFQRYLVKELANRFISLRDRYESAKVYSLDVRLAKYILSSKEEGEIIENLKKISEDLNSSYRQIMRVFNRFCKMGWIEHLEQKGKYVLKDSNALRNMAEIGEE